MATPEAGYLKCACQHCTGPIEFPAHGVGVQIDCPHCGQKTTLQRLPTAPPASAPSGPVRAPAAAATSTSVASPPKPPPALPPSPSAAPPRSSRRRTMVISAAVVVGLLLVAGVALAILRGRNAARMAAAAPSQAEAPSNTRRTRPERPAKNKSASDGDGGIGGAPQSNSLAKAASTAMPSSPPPGSSPKSISQLQTGGLTLEKAVGSSLVYAVGSLTNASAHQRYDVNIYVALMDAAGKPAGTARDQRSALEPREVWRFRALVLDSRARTGAIANITEEP